MSFGTKLFIVNSQINIFDIQFRDLDFYLIANVLLGSMVKLPTREY
jgi:hypothetical protein